MRTQSTTLSAAGVSPWIPVDYLVSPFSLTISCVCSSNINATYKVQYTPDDIFKVQNCSITRSTTTATLKLTNHGLTTNDSITVVGSGDPNLDGTYTVASVSDQNTITYTVSNTGATVSAPSAGVIVMRVFDHATITGKTGNFDGSLTVPVRAVRLNVTPYTAGYVSMILNQGAL